MSQLLLAVHYISEQSSLPHLKTVCTDPLQINRQMHMGSCSSLILMNSSDPCKSTYMDEALSDQDHLHMLASEHQA